MDTSAPWRALETPENAQPEPPPQRLRLDTSRLLLAAVGVLVAVFAVGASGCSVAGPGGRPGGGGVERRQHRRRVRGAGSHAARH